LRHVRGCFLSGAENPSWPGPELQVLDHGEPDLPVELFTGHRGVEQRPRGARLKLLGKESIEESAAVTTTLALPAGGHGPDDHQAVLKDRRDARSKMPFGIATPDRHVAGVDGLIGNGDDGGGPVKAVALSQKFAGSWKLLEGECFGRT
jgi:hypothetical protein